MNATTSRYRLLVKSIGTADASVIPALRQVRPAPDAELAALVYRAPSELLTDLDEATGTRLRDLLRQTGVEVDLTPTEESFARGVGEYEVALVIRRVEHVISIVELVMRVLGVDVDAARKLVCEIPAVLLGSVSKATVDALRNRFSQVDVELDASQPRTAQFDIVAEATDQLTRTMVEDALAEFGAAAAWTGRGQLIATGFDMTAATQMWERLARTSARIRMLNRDLQRFDVRLESAPRTEAVRQWLMDATGMPRRIAESAVDRTPLTLVEQVTSRQMIELLGQAQGLGARASGVLLAVQRFALAVRPGGVRLGVVAWVEAMAGQADAAAFLRGGPTRLAGPFTKTQARWLQYELRRGGVASQLLER